jgi:hypothetical protein
MCLNHEENLMGDECVSSGLRLIGLNLIGDECVSSGLNLIGDECVSSGLIGDMIGKL